ncbi:FecR domain-containing protein [Pseudomonas sp. UL073]|uniref:FecR domain-containing protein n=1 Tax=Zestomonas insulae TaxID=2809017 RepID=A0ABS2IDW7_9GAMM|nr:FecR domain-containing protein [Pseudomonas insulae]MBM7060033.1 FecR domain-containing protein [Pseudomonas insulae]
MSRQPLDQQRLALKSAAQWYAVLGAEQVREEDRRAWRDWQAQHPVNQWAWQRVEGLHTQLRGLPGQLAYDTFAKAGGSPLDRRSVLKGLLLVAGTGGLVYSGYPGSPAEWLADYRTATGEQRRITLSDGTRLTLNTASAVDVRFDAGQRRLELQAGEILVETAKDSARPFIVHTRHGRIRALGTRFTVRQHAERSEVAVLQHAVAVSPAHGAQAETRVDAGQRLSFDAQRVASLHSADPLQAEWANGRLVVNDWRLVDLLAELDRYRPGLLGCDPKVAELRLSGAYPLDDTDRALAAIARAVPVQVLSRTRYWVRVLPRG